MRVTRKRRKILQAAGKKGGSSRSAAKIAAVRENGKRHVGRQARPRSLTDMFAEEVEKFKKDHPELFPD